ncbi:glycosyltransferase family 39 protein [Candidatus Saccharibacteria bacterium]|nr:glycosyltransferase family 39 protein [Candidatus Saccharibacteria bacterium]
MSKKPVNKKPASPKKQPSKKPNEELGVAKQITLYRYRYLIGYVFFAFILLFMVVYKIWDMPAGLSQSEIASVTNSAWLNTEALQSNAAAIINLPYHLLQKFSVMIFGANLWALRLPSVILAILSGVVLERLLGRLFKRNVAVIATILAVSSVLFITLAHDGSPMIMNAFLTIMLTYLATRVFHGDKAGVLWQVLLVLTLALSLYSPLGLVPLAGILIACFNKDVRARVRQIPIWTLIIFVVVLAVVLAPLVLSLVLNFTDTVKAWLAWSDWGSLSDNASALGILFLDMPAGDFVSSFAPSIFGLPLLLLTIIGLVRAIIDHKSPRSYLILTWFIVLIPILLFNHRAIYLMFVPISLLVTMGVAFLLDSWNRLFPINPYARVAGLIPIAVLMVGIVTLTLGRYFNLESYAPNVVLAYNQTPVAVFNEVARQDEQVKLLVSENERAFYRLLGNEVEIIVEPPQDFARLLVAPSVQELYVDKLPKTPTRIVVSQLKDDSVLLRVYEK